MNYYNQSNPRFGGLLLPFLAGVAVTTPFVFFAKNQNSRARFREIIEEKRRFSKEVPRKTKIVLTVCKRHAITILAPILPRSTWFVKQRSLIKYYGGRNHVHFYGKQGQH